MAKHLSRQEFITQQEFFLEEARQHKIFFYPTDTIYGIGTISTPANKSRINGIKQRPAHKTLSVIAPDIERIRKQYAIPELPDIVTKERLEFFLDTHKAVTFVFDPHFWGGVRIIRHPFQEFVRKLGEPFISSSVNPSGHQHCDSPATIHPDILPHIDYIIDAGILDNPPSVLINLVSGDVVARD